MNVLASFCNIRAPGVPCFALLDLKATTVGILDTPTEIRRCAGITGLALDKRFLYAAVQPSDELALSGSAGRSVLLVIDRRRFEVVSHYPFQLGADIHSLCVAGDRLYAVSTGTDEVLELGMHDATVISEVAIWRPDDTGPRADVHHLNAVCEWQGDFWVSAFGKKSGAQWDTARNGFVANLRSGEMIARGIHHPHSLAAVGDSLAYCESRGMAVRFVNDGPVQSLPGYTRGICLAEGAVYVGTSVGRRVSKSSGTINNPASGGVLGGRCTISRLRPHTLEIEYTVDLTAHAQEIYDLLPVDGVEHWPIADELRWRDGAIEELAGVLDRRTTWAKQATAAREQSEAAVHRLEAELHEQAAELSSLREDFDWWSSLASVTLQRYLPDSELTAQFQVRAIRTVVRGLLPMGATVAVISKGDPELTNLAGRKVLHFPQSEDGAYAGCYPAASSAAIAHLEALRLKGSEFLVIPSTASWWLDYYKGFAAHLRNGYRQVAGDHAVCTIFDLRNRLPRKATDKRCAASHALAQCQKRLGRPPAVLDWNTNAGIAEQFSGCTVFFPPSENGTRLPYLDHTVDVVAVADDAESAAEARRVGTFVLIKVANGTSGDAAHLEVEWLVDPAQREAPSVSVVAGCPSDHDGAMRYLAQLRSILHEDGVGELLVLHAPEETVRALEGLNGEEPTLRFIEPAATDGYGPAHNKAAIATTGDVVVFLDGVLPLDGWLVPLLDAFGADETVGIVGGKLISSVGVLHAAGSVVFADGTVANLGQGDYQVDDPLYGHVRAVDFMTGLVAIRRSLFDQLGGFDRSFRTASFACADLCMTAHRAQAQVIYQPECVGVSLCFAEPAPAPHPDPCDTDWNGLRRKWAQELGYQPAPVSRRDRDTWHALAVRETAMEVCP